MNKSLLAFCACQVVGACTYHAFDPNHPEPYAEFWCNDNNLQHSVGSGGAMLLGSDGADAMRPMTDRERTEKLIRSCDQIQEKRYREAMDQTEQLTLKGD